MRPADARSFRSWLFNTFTEDPDPLPRKGHDLERFIVGVERLSRLHFEMDT